MDRPRPTLAPTGAPRQAARPRRGRRAFRARRASLTAAVLCLALTASCSAPDDEQVASAGASPTGGTEGASGASSRTPQQQGQLLVECLRENGIEVGDADEHGAIGPVGDDVPDAEVQSALNSCSHIDAPAMSTAGGEPVPLEEQKEFAECMRSKGLDWPDPDVNGTPDFDPGDLGVDDATLMSYANECFG